MLKAYFLWLIKFITVLIILLFIPIVLGGLFVSLSAKNQDNFAFSNQPRVAVVEIQGVILDSKKILKQLHAFIDDKKITGIVLRIDSPGGAVGPSQEIYSAVAKLKSIKPIVASMGSVAASGGLYSALSANKIFAQPGTLTGSIGVIMQTPNVQKIAKKVGFTMNTIKSGKFKDVGNAFRSMTSEDKEFLQNTISVVYEDFKQAVVKSRNLKVEDVEAFADGRVIVGSDALKYGLIDGYADVYESAVEVCKLANKKIGKNKYPKLVYVDDKFEKLSEFFSAITNLPKVIEDLSFNSKQGLYY